MPAYPDAYVSYLVEFHATRDYFECHELLEEFWKEHPDDSRSELWVGLIQLAVGAYHERRGNSRGAAMMYKKSSVKLDREQVEQLGIDRASLAELIGARLSVLESGDAGPYADMDIPIHDDNLLRECKARCTERGIEWRSSSLLHNEELVHRHKRRDRREVIQARSRALAEKQKERRDST